MFQKSLDKMKNLLVSWWNNQKALVSDPLFRVLFLWAFHLALLYQGLTILVAISGPVVGTYSLLYILRWYRTFSERKGLGTIIKPLPMDTSHWPKSRSTRERYRQYATYRKEHPNQTIEKIAERFEVEPITIQRAIEAERAGALLEVNRVSLTEIIKAITKYHRSQLMHFLREKLRRSSKE